jgi:hypothetical protein
MAHSSTMKMGATSSSETSADFQRDYTALHLRRPRGMHSNKAYCFGIISSWNSPRLPTEDIKQQNQPNLQEKLNFQKRPITLKKMVYKSAAQATNITLVSPHIQ